MLHMECYSVVTQQLENQASFQALLMSYFRLGSASEHVVSFTMVTLGVLVCVIFRREWALRGHKPDQLWKSSTCLVNMWCYTA